MPALLRIIRRSLPIITPRRLIRASRQQHLHQLRIPSHRRLVQRSKPATLRLMHIRPALNQYAHRLAVSPQGQTRMQRLIAHWIMRNLVNMRAMFQQQAHRLRVPKRSRKVQRSPSIPGNGPRSPRIFSEQPSQAIAICASRSLKHIQPARLRL